MRVRNMILMVLFSLCIAAQCFAADRYVTLLTHTWEPYVGPDMPSNGISAAIVRMAFESAGYEVKMSFNNWDVSLKMAKNGEADALFPTYHTTDRETYFLYSEPFLTSPLGLCKMRPVHSFSPGGVAYDRMKKELIQYKTDPRVDQTQALRDLSKYTFGVGKGYANTPEFDTADFLTKITAANDEENILQLLQGEVQLIVIDKYVAKNIMVKKFPWRSGDIQFMEPPLSEKDLYLTVSKKTKHAKQILTDFNDGLKVIRQEGKIKRLMRVYGF
ncbi:MAG TPA: transporter substrate-binding domain-containing protein [Desulfotignum sp.]|nr:transporter substrate-binding domain-containing protein [Desulfotignum sp.]